MTQVTEYGATLCHLMPAFYHRPQTIDDIVNQTVNRVLDVLILNCQKDLFTRWQGEAIYKMPRDPRCFGT